MKNFFLLFASAIISIASFALKVHIPKDAVAGQTIHFILEATDDGSPSLTRYQRIIITIK